MTDSDTETVIGDQPLADSERAATFPLHQLPTEIQMQIWLEAYQSDRQILEIRGGPEDIIFIPRLLPIPAAFQTPSLARAAVLDPRLSRDNRMRSLSLNPQNRFWLSSKGGQKYLWFDQDRDTAYWNGPHAGLNHQKQLHKKLPELRYLMIRPAELHSMNMRTLFLMFPRLKVVKVFMGGIDFDYRRSSEDMHIRHVEVDLEDENMNNKVSAFIPVYCAGLALDMRFKSVYALNNEWRLLTQDTEDIKFDDDCWRRNTRAAFKATDLCEYSSLDKEGHHFIPTRYHLRSEWKEYLRIQERNYIGYPRWFHLTGAAWDAEPQHLRIAHTREYYQALERMPAMKRVAILRLLGDVGDLWSEHSVVVGAIRAVPPFDPRLAAALRTIDQEYQSTMERWDGSIFG